MLRNSPSSLYRADVWRLGKWVVRRIPDHPCDWISQFLAVAYWRLNYSRRQVVIDNLLPALGDDRSKASALSRLLFKQFARKVTDLWRYESGLSIEDLVSDWRGWKNLEVAQKSGRGLLLLTPHLGNWELGAPLLARRGLKLLVITLREPEEELTRLRQDSRSRRGIETLVIGENPFGFVEVIRRLEKGALVALLVDRPPASSSTLVNLFGRPFAASVAAAELARATGCALLPVCIPYTSAGYCAEVFPEISYSRSALGSKQARQQLTQEIVQTFEPVIAQHLTQWYHFVPIWPRT